MEQKLIRNIELQICRMAWLFTCHGRKGTALKPVVPNLGVATLPPRETGTSRFSLKGEGLLQPQWLLPHHNSGSSKQTGAFPAIGREAAIPSAVLPTTPNSLLLQSCPTSTNPKMGCDHRNGLFGAAGRTIEGKATLTPSGWPVLPSQVP